jgi:hypothetical protein
MADGILWGGALFERAREVLAAQPSREVTAAPESTKSTTEVGTTQLQNWLSDLRGAIDDIQHGNRRDHEIAMQTLLDIRYELDNVLRSR